MSVADALDNNFDVVEIDVRTTRDGLWVVHHDTETGRVTGTYDNSRFEISQLTNGEWYQLRHRNMDTGMLSIVVPPTFEDLTDVISAYRKPHQKINIEIKGNSYSNDLRMLDYLAANKIGDGNYFYSSLKLINLERMQKINPDVFVAYIQAPATQSLHQLQQTLTKGVANDPVYQKNKELGQHYIQLGKSRRWVVRYDQYGEITKLKSNFGLYLDIRHFGQSYYTLMPEARKYGVKVGTYTDDH